MRVLLKRMLFKRVFWLLVIEIGVVVLIGGIYTLRGFSLEGESLSKSLAGKFRSLASQLEGYTKNQTVAEHGNDSISVKDGSCILSDRVFLWDDRIPERWRHLPLAKENSSTCSTSEAATENQDGSSSLIYNRLGKSGSRYIIAVLKELALKKRRFFLISSVVYTQKILEQNHQKHIVRVLDQLKRPYVFERHMYYFDLGKFGLHTRPLPAFINIVRDPMMRFLSQYNYKRFGDGLREGRIFDNKSIDECIFKKQEECTKEGSFKIVPVFCGHDERCRTPSEWALQRAMDNVEHHYVFVGLTEELENSLKLLEQLLPKFFRGAVALTKSSKHISQVRRKTKSKGYRPSPEAEAIMRQRLQLEYRFYQFIVDRFNALKMKYGLS